MKVKLIIISIILLLVIVFASGCIPIMEKLGLVSPTNEKQLSPEKGGPPDGLVKVLIGFKEKPGPPEQAMVKGAGGQIKYTYHIVDAIAASIPEKAIEALRKNPNVTHVELDGEIFAIDDLLPWGVNRIDAEEVHTSGNKGEGVNVAILDTGIDPYHPDLSIEGGENFSPGKKSYDDKNGHGTHVAGIVAALDNGMGVIGVAPKVNLYAVKVLGDRGIGRWSDLIAGLQWCVDNEMEVANMSLGATSAPSDVKAACGSAYAAGVLLVAAAGNESGGPVIYPAAYDSVIAVSATNSEDGLASFSSVGDEVELAAPGVDINSTLLGGGYGEKSGTSMAAPHVAGTAALVICSGVVSDSDGEYGIANEVRARLFDTAQNIGLLLEERGNGLVDAEKAVLGTTYGDDLTPHDTGNISGTVTDADEGSPIAGGDVTANEYSTTTLDDGSYLISDLSVGSYTVIASADGYENASQDVTVIADTTITLNVDFALNPLPTTGTIHISNIDMSLKIAGINVNAIATVTIVDDSEPNQSVEGAIVSGYWEDATTDTDSGVTDASGKVSLLSDKVKIPKGETATFTFTVNYVIKDGYSPLTDVEESDSIPFPE